MIEKIILEHRYEADPKSDGTLQVRTVTISVKQKKKKYARNVKISFKYNPRRAVILYISDEELEPFIFYENGEQIFPIPSVEKFYKGEKKEKIIMYSNTYRPMFNDNFILKNYKHIFSIDTNHKTLENGNSLYVCIGIKWNLDFYKSSTSKLVSIHPSNFTISYETFGDYKENYFWARYLLLNILNKIKGVQKGKILLIVDSDLQNIKDYNLHKKPFYSGRIHLGSQCYTQEQDYVLPDNCEFMYGRGDAESCFIPNLLIKTCDEIVSYVIDDIVKMGDFDCDNITALLEKETMEYKKQLLKKIKDKTTSIKTEGLVKMD